MKEKKQEYQKPQLRKVRIEVKTSVLSVCNTSTVSQPFENGFDCRLNQCLSPWGTPTP